ncbi:unnamed protein product [Pleuronectes platessa]|uniref:Uncharacterized protein n=1 Tax=Pleuronectes platessa TaxID=8262 RepID=A0A9N7ZEG9_PLEPL|nr:unnamed protein product [Pleuronectes platessa]
MWHTWGDQYLRGLQTGLLALLHRDPGAAAAGGQQTPVDERLDSASHIRGARSKKRRFSEDQDPGAGGELTQQQEEEEEERGPATTRQARHPLVFFLSSPFFPAVHQRQPAP